MHQTTVIQRALLSVYDKTDIIPLAESLHLMGVELISTGNTAAVLQEHGLPVTPVSTYTGFPEIMNGRVKTLHPKIYGGILGRRDIDADIMLAHNIPDIDLVVVNLYPFQKISSDPTSSFVDIIENIDIGGPAMIRAAAKNFDWCTVIVDPTDYKLIIHELQTQKGTIKEETRFHLAAKAFEHTMAYDTAIAQFFASKDKAANEEVFKPNLSLHYRLKEKLRYGENPHQIGAFYQENNPPRNSISACQQQQGKPLSFNNFADGDIALECVKQFATPACVIVKHANPCGVAIGAHSLEAYEKAYQCDPLSAFGGIIAFNQQVDENLMQKIFSQQFVELIIAPSFTVKALEIGKQKPDCRLLQYQASTENHPHLLDIRSINGGLLVQTKDLHSLSLQDCKVVTQRAPSAEQMQDLLFAWQVVKFIKSNAIVFAKQGQTLGIGTGQMSRIFSTQIAALKAEQNKLALNESVMASDAFFPFADSIENAAAHGVTAIIQPGGSKRDPEVIDCANQFNMAMVFTGLRCFRH